MNGWDLDKTLRLLYKSNPTLYEWLNSPICYCRTDFCDRIAPLMNEYFSVKNSLYHYLNTARSTIKNHLLGETVKPKKYFYALRPLLACHWVMENKTPPPVLFDTLVEAMLPDSLRSAVDYLLDIKVNTPEKAEIKPVSEIDIFLKENIAKFDEIMKNLPQENNCGWDMMNEFFISELED